MFRKFFKKGADPQIGLQKLRKMVTMLEKKEVLLEAKIRGLREKAKDYAKKGNKRLALQILKRKKDFENQLLMFSNQKMNMLTLQDKIEQQIMNKEMMNITKESKNTMQSLMGKNTVEDVQETVEDLRDKMADVDEVSQALGESVGNEDVLDDVDDDLEMLFNEVAEEKMSKVELPKQNLPQQVAEKRKNTSMSQQAEDEANQLLAELAL